MSQNECCFETKVRQNPISGTSTKAGELTLNEVCVFYRWTSWLLLDHCRRAPVVWYPGLWELMCTVHSLTWHGQKMSRMHQCMCSKVSTNSAAGNCTCSSSFDGFSLHFCLQAFASVDRPHQHGTAAMLWSRSLAWRNPTWSGPGDQLEHRPGLHNLPLHTARVCSHISRVLLNPRRFGDHPVASRCHSLGRRQASRGFRGP